MAIIKNYDIPASGEYGILCEIQGFDFSTFNEQTPFYLYLNLVRKNEMPGPSLLLKVVGEAYDSSKFITISPLNCSVEQTDTALNIYHIRDITVISNLENNFKFIPGVLFEIKDLTETITYKCVYLKNGYFYSKNLIDSGTYKITRYYNYSHYSVAYLLDKYWFYNIIPAEVDNSFYPDLIYQEEAFITSLNPIASSKFLIYYPVISSQPLLSQLRFFLYTNTYVYGDDTNRITTRRISLGLDYKTNSSLFLFDYLDNTYFIGELNNYFDVNDNIKLYTLIADSGIYQVSASNITNFDHFFMFHNDDYNPRKNTISINLIPFQSSLALVVPSDDPNNLINKGQHLFYYSIAVEKTPGQQVIPSLIAVKPSNNTFVELVPSYVVNTNQGMDSVSRVGYDFYPGFLVGKIDRQVLLESTSRSKDILVLNTFEVYSSFYKDPSSLIVRVEPDIEIRDITDIIGSQQIIISDTQVGGRILGILAYDSTNQTLCTITSRTDRLNPGKRVEFYIPSGYSFTSIYAIVEMGNIERAQASVDNTINANPFQQIYVHSKPIIMLLHLSNLQSLLREALSMMGQNPPINDIVSKAITVERVIRSKINNDGSDFYKNFVFYLERGVGINLKQHPDYQISPSTILVQKTMLV